MRKNMLNIFKINYLTSLSLDEIQTWTYDPSKSTTVVFITSYKTLVNLKIIMTAVIQ